MKLSIILPCYRDLYLNKTIDSILENAVEDIEIIPVIDCYDLEEPIIVDSRVKPIILKQHLGMRGAINTGLAKARGEFVMKLDAHCIVAPGFDKILCEDCKENWLMIPKKYAVNEKDWTKNPPEIDYHYLVFPEVTDESYGYSMQVTSWRNKRNDIEIDDIMIFQGSCWFANRKDFMQRVGFLDDSLSTYGSFAHEQLEVGLKYWLSGGDVKVNKKTWYAHLFKQKRHYTSGMFSRKHKKDKYHISGNEWGTKHWVNNQEVGMKYSFSWYIEKFWPIPTWPDDWKCILIKKGIINNK